MYFPTSQKSKFLSLDKSKKQIPIPSTSQKSKFLSLALTLPCTGCIFRQVKKANSYPFGMFAAMIVPFMILMYKRTAGALIVSSLIVLGTQFMARFDLVVQGFRVPVFRVYDMPERISYFPSVIEMLVVVASVSVVAVVYGICEKTGLFEIAGKESH